MGSEGFSTRDIEVEGAVIRARVGGEGPPLLLLHGHPQTHAMWHRVAPGVARDHTVVLADLRGFGDSSPPAPGWRYVCVARTCARRPHKPAVPCRPPGGGGRVAGRRRRA